MQAGILPSAVPVRQWNTEVVAPAQRLDYWVGAICEAFLEMDCSSREAGCFEGRLASVEVDALSFNRVLASSQDVFRTPRGIARGAEHPLYLITQSHSRWHVRQGGQVVALRPGDTVLVDSAHCYEFHFPGGVDTLSIQIPRRWLGRWLAQVDSPVPRVAARDQGWGQALSALCVQFAQDPTLAAGYPPALLNDQIGAMLAAALEPRQAQAPAEPAARGLADRALQRLRARLDQPGLTAQDIAGELGVSLRTLHRAFAAHQTSFAGALRGLRLAQAAQLLAQPRLAGVSVAEVGRRCGFADASHFVREFQRLQGRTPARWRREHLPT